VRDGQGADKPVVEDWIIRVLSSAAGAALIEVSILGPPRVPPSPSPREPGFEVSFPTADSSFSAIELVRLFHRPALTSKGAFVVLERDVSRVDGGVQARTGVFSGRTRDVREVRIALEGGTLVRGDYRVVIADDVPVLGILEAELDETWTSLAPDGSLVVERRHDRFVLSDAHDALETR
jgi:hypothetical protein